MCETIRKFEGLTPRIIALLVENHQGKITFPHLKVNTRNHLCSSSNKLTYQSGIKLADGSSKVQDTVRLTSALGSLPLIAVEVGFSESC